MGLVCCSPVWPRSAASPTAVEARAGRLPQRDRRRRRARAAAQALRLQHRRDRPARRVPGLRGRRRRWRHGRRLPRHRVAVAARDPRVQAVGAQGPGVLVAVVVATVAVGRLRPGSPRGQGGRRGARRVPDPGDPRCRAGRLGHAALAALGMAFVTLADTSALVAEPGRQTGRGRRPNQEIAALGAANLAAGMFQGFPVSVSASRSAVAEDTGARTQLTGVVGAAAIIVILVAANGIVADLQLDARRHRHRRRAEPVRPGHAAMALAGAQGRADASSRHCSGWR